MNANAHLLVVEDEDKIAAALEDYLRAAGYRTSRLADGREVAAWVRANTPDAVLLDVMLPGLDGLDVCRALRTFSQVPILMLTARVEEIDRLIGLELGADDYICKPFSLREVVARVRAVLRRAQVAALATPPAGIELDAQRFEVRVHGKPMVVTPVEFRLLEKLVAHPGRVWSRQHLMDAIYTDHRIVSDRTVDSHVRNLRRKFDELGIDPIESVYGVGFRLVIE